MKIFRLLLAGFLFAFAAALVNVALPGKPEALEDDSRLIGIVDRYCAPQWHALTTADQAPWLEVTPEHYAGRPIEVLEDNPDAASFEAWNKHNASTLALQEHILSFFTLYKSLSEEDDGTEDEFADAFASYRAKYDLWSCLSLNRTERQQLDAKLHSIDKTIDVMEIYQLETKYHCLGLERIREAAFSLAPADLSFPEDFREIVYEHLRLC